MSAKLGRMVGDLLDRQAAPTTKHHAPRMPKSEKERIAVGSSVNLIKGALLQTKQKRELRGN